METAVAKPAPRPTDRRWSESDALVIGVGVLLLLAGAGLAAIRFAGASPGEPGASAATGACALGLVVTAPGILALLGRHDRPALLLPAAVVLIPFSFLSFALVTLPLLIPAVMLFTGYGRRSRAHPIGGLRATAVTVVVLALLVAALAALVVHPDPREYVTAGGREVYGTSDVITAAEALVSFALVGAALAAGWVLAAPRPPRA